MLANVAGIKLQAIPVTTVSAAALTTSFVIMNGGGTPQPCYELVISNGSDVDVVISFDGVTPHFYISAGYERPLRGILNQSTWPKLLKVYIRAATAGTGTIALSGLYSK